MIVSAAIARVRETLQDMDASRYTDQRIMDAFNLGIADLRRLRPDVFIGRYHLPVFQITSVTEEFDVPELYISPLVKFAVGWVELADDEYVQDGRADGALKAFMRDIGIPTT